MILPPHLQQHGQWKPWLLPPGVSRVIRGNELMCVTVIEVFCLSVLALVAWPYVGIDAHKKLLFIVLVILVGGSVLTSVILALEKALARWVKRHSVRRVFKNEIQLSRLNLFLCDHPDAFALLVHWLKSSPCREPLFAHWVRLQHLGKQGVFGVAPADAPRSSTRKVDEAIRLAEAMKRRDRMEKSWAVPCPESPSKKPRL